jgi:quercetin dioxygenase-like cupin family protein
MKHVFARSALVAASIALIASLGATIVAQDPIKVAPKMYKVLFENDRVRVMEVTFKPGEEIVPHSHPDHYVYVVQGGKLQITNDAGKTDAELKAGDVMWIKAEKHFAKNIGTTTVKLVVSELK